MLRSVTLMLRWRSCPRRLQSTGASGRGGGGRGRRKADVRKTDVRNRAQVEAAAKRKREADEARHMAQWASHWMMPWERAQMDVPGRPLRTWERVYWRLFLVFGTTGFLYETYVLQNRRVLRGDQIMSDVGTNATAHHSDLQHDRAFNEHRLLTDEDVLRLSREPRSA